MEVEITSKKNKPLLERTEVEFQVTHSDAASPTRESVKAVIAEKMKAPKDAVVIDRMRAEFGMNVTKGYAKVYKDAAACKKWERHHILVRNKLAEKKAKVKKVKKSEGSK